jgi:hypothetical protein
MKQRKLSLTYSRDRNTGGEAGGTMGINPAYNQYTRRDKYSPLDHKRDDTSTREKEEEISGNRHRKA